jgi:hypothetical protein
MPRQRLTRVARRPLTRRPPGRRNCSRTTSTTTRDALVRYRNKLHAAAISRRGGSARNGRYAHCRDPSVRRIISGTIDTPSPAATIAAIVASCAPRITTGGRRLRRSHRRDTCPLRQCISCRTRTGYGEIG